MKKRYVGVLLFCCVQKICPKGLFEETLNLSKAQAVMAVFCKMYDYTHQLKLRDQLIKLEQTGDDSAYHHLSETLKSWIDIRYEQDHYQTNRVNALAFTQQDMQNLLAEKQFTPRQQTLFWTDVSCRVDDFQRNLVDHYLFVIKQG